ncbi:MAG: DUF5103 domain-containing protein [Prolixibacteraceae bacterium]|nr:DUF5103 domain-containing protein [Prolixibacteraceae bacterium]MBN2775485.1 DUF5103 domain-containing protein [Prolixibacteraceae bacterium]
MNRIFLLTIFVSVIYNGFTQVNEYYYENAVYKEDIKTVQLYRDGFELSNPILKLGEETLLLLKFDDLSGEVKDYYYTIIHCDADWNESFLMQNDYLEGFPDNPIDDYALSFNTTFKYVNYQVMIPNENVQLTLSGNYVILVYEDNDKENLVLTKRFMVLDEQVNVEGTVRRATLDAFKGENHEIDFSIIHDNFRIENPAEEVKVVIQQNNRWDNAITTLNPLFIREDVLVYDYDRENVLPAGNEFRFFDIRSIKNIGEGVFNLEFHRPYYHYTLIPDEPRAGTRYFPHQEMNGKYAIESQDRIVDDFDLECDYVFVHFRFTTPSILLGGSVNVFGGLTDWNANKSNEMTWNFEEGCYELTLLLKQGYYNYEYVYVEDGSKTANHTSLEGSYWETNNDYQIYVYYRNISDRYDRLIGFKQLSLR